MHCSFKSWGRRNVSLRKARQERAGSGISTATGRQHVSSVRAFHKLFTIRKLEIAKNAKAARNEKSCSKYSGLPESCRPNCESSSRSVLFSQKCHDILLCKIDKEARVPILWKPRVRGIKGTHHNLLKANNDSLFSSGLNQAKPSYPQAG